MARPIHFEIHADDMDRARRFYEGNILGMMELDAAAA
jgi:predicted enzyme related to lactoylglutathione lyase